MILNKQRRWFHASFEKLPLVELVLGVNIFDLDVWFQFDSVE